MKNFKSPVRACIIGASGGIGHATLSQLSRDPDISHIYATSRSGTGPDTPNTSWYGVDFAKPDTVEGLAEDLKEAPPHLIICASGFLHDSDTGPEKSYRQMNMPDMEKTFLVNTFGPALVARHLLPLWPRSERCLFAALSARVGSISDNRLGGWHSYRASKAALNMILKNLAIELGRTHKQAVIAGLHPGTVDTALSEPFQGNVPDGKLFDPEFSAGRLLGVLDGLQPDQSGKVFDWDNKEVPA